MKLMRRTDPFRRKLLEARSLASQHLRMSKKPVSLLQDITRDHPPFAIEGFEFDQPGEVADVVRALGGALPGDLLMLAQDSRQRQLIEVMEEPDLVRRGNAPLAPFLIFLTLV